MKFSITTLVSVFTIGVILCAHVIDAVEVEAEKTQKTASQKHETHQHQQHHHQQHQQQPTRHSTRSPSPADDLSQSISDHARLLFRAMDHDYDHKISAEDVKQSQSILHHQLPGVTTPEFLQFLELADKDNDKKLNKEEFLSGLAEGLSHTDLIQTDSKLKKGFIGSVINAVKGVASSVGSLFGIGGGKKAGAEDPNKVSHKQDACVMCQYIVERIETNVKTAGILGNFGGQGMRGGFQSFLEVSSAVFPTLRGRFSGRPEQERPASNNLFTPQNEQQQQINSDAVSFVEVETKVDPTSISSGAVVGSTRQSSRYQRQVERQKFNDIYRVSDITLDDVCEQGMPDVFYATCSQVYEKQSDIVDGLRYQYRPADICFRTKICAEDSYITKGLHSQFKPKPQS